MTERVAAGVEDLPQDVTRHENVYIKNNNNNKIILSPYIYILSMYKHKVEKIVQPYTF